MMYARKHIAPKILQRRIPVFPNAPLPADLPPVHTLVSKHDWLLSMWMLSSWSHSTKRNWDIVIHEDGSLGNSEISAICQAVPGVQIIRRNIADSAMAPVLEGMPRCLDYRQRMPHGLKCFDVPHFARSSRFFLIDPDVLFFREPTQMLAWADSETDPTCWFNRDPQEPSPISQESAQSEYGIDLWRQVNSGLCLLDRGAIDYHQMETWLGHTDLAEGNQWRVEQSLLVLACSQRGEGGLLPGEYEVSLTKNHVHPDPVSRHYVGAVRHRFFGEGVAQLRKVLLS